MRTLLFGLALSFAGNVHAGTADVVKTEWCLPSFPYSLYVSAAGDNNQFFLGQLNPALSRYGVIQMTTHTVAHKGERLNILVQYVKTKKAVGPDGFEHEVDLWRQCDKLKGRAQ